MPLIPVMEKPGGIPIVTINPDAWCRRANVGRGKRRHRESAQTQTTRLNDPSGAGKNIRGLRLKPERISTTAREALQAWCKAGCRCGPRSKSRRIPSWRFPLLPRGFISLFGIYEAAPVVCDRRHFFALLAPIPRAKGLAGTAPDPCHSPQPEAPWAPRRYPALSPHAVQPCRHIGVLVSLNPRSTCAHERVLCRYFGSFGGLVSGFSFSSGAARRPARPWRLSRLA